MTKGLNMTGQLIIACFTLLAATTCWAQAPERGPDGPPDRGFRDRDRPPGQFAPPPHPLMTALDTDGDNQLSAAEIAAASTALQQLDSNSDGVLQPQELRPRLFERPQTAGGKFRHRAAAPQEGKTGGPRVRPARGELQQRSRQAQGSNQDNRRFELYADRIMNFDANQDGIISGDELPERMQRMIQRGDQDADGALSREEILGLVERR
jgi:hypothetical protein